MNKIEELKREDVLLSEKNKAIKDITITEINIAILERTDPNTVMAKKPTQKDAQGNVTAYSPVTAKQMLANSREDLESQKLRLNVIETLMK